MLFDYVRTAFGILAAVLTFALLVVLAFVPIPLCESGVCVTYDFNSGFLWHPALIVLPVILGIFAAWLCWGRSSPALARAVVGFLASLSVVLGGFSYETVFGHAPSVEPSAGLQAFVVYVAAFVIPSIVLATLDGNPAANSDTRQYE